MLDNNDVEIEYSSASDYDYLVCDVWYKDKYMFMLNIIDVEAKTISINFFENSKVRDPFSGMMNIDDYIDIIEFAKQRYFRRMFGD